MVMWRIACAGVWGWGWLGDNETFRFGNSEWDAHCRTELCPLNWGLLIQQACSFHKFFAIYSTVGMQQRKDMLDLLKQLFLISLIFLSETGWIEFYIHEGPVWIQFGWNIPQLNWKLAVCPSRLLDSTYTYCSKVFPFCAQLIIYYVDVVQTQISDPQSVI